MQSGGFLANPHDRLFDNDLQQLARLALLLGVLCD